MWKSGSPRAPLRAAIACCLGLAVAALVPAAWAQQEPVARLQGETRGEAASPEWATANLLYLGDLVGFRGAGRAWGGRGIGSLQVGLGLDLDAAGISGLHAQFDGLSLHGSSPSGLVGDIQTTSNIDVPGSARLYQAYLDQSWAEGRFGLRAGIQDLNLEFNVTDSSLLFLNASFGMSPELAFSGALGPSTFPFTGLGARFQLSPVEGLELRAAVYDAVPGDPDRPSRMSFRLSSEEGYFTIAEAARAFEVGGLPGRFAAGGWRHSNRQARLDGAGEAVSAGGYLTLEQQIYARRRGERSGLTGFVRAGLADASVNVIDRSLAAGVSLEGLVPGRADDRIGLGMALAHASRFAPAEGERASETALELTYRAQLTGWLALQPDVQWVAHPGFRADTAPAWVMGSRLELAL